MADESPGSGTTQWSQIRRAAADSAADREAFARRYQPLLEVYFRARWGRSAMTSEIADGVQEVFLECLRKSGALGRVEERRAGGFRAFLHGIVRNVASRIEARRRRASGSVLDEAAPAQTESPDRAFFRKWAGLLLEEASTSLRERAQILGRDAERRIEILRLRFEENLPIRDIAPRVGLAAAAAHKHYTLARQEFQEALRKIVRTQAPEASPAEIDSECRELLRLIED